MFITEFVNMVRKMRAAQQSYFRNGRKTADLILSKDLEKVVDKALAEGVTMYETHTLTEPTAEEARQLELLMEDERDAADLLDETAE